MQMAALKPDKHKLIKKKHMYGTKTSVSDSNKHRSAYKDLVNSAVYSPLH